MNTSNIRDTRATVTEFFGLLGQGDAQGIAAVFAERIDWYVPSHAALPWTGARTRGDQIPGYFQTLWAHLHTEQSVARLDHLIVEGEHAVALGQFSHVASTTGRPFTTPFSMHLKVAHGLITHLHLYEDTYAVSQAFTA